MKKILINTIYIIAIILQIMLFAPALFGFLSFLFTGFGVLILLYLVFLGFGTDSQLDLITISIILMFICLGVTILIEYLEDKYEFINKIN